jgi:hypothetical protein
MDQEFSDYRTSSKQSLPKEDCVCDHDVERDEQTACILASSW